MKTHPTIRKSAGFTIVELMIATVVFSLVLLAITAGVLSFTNSYYKGVNNSNTQATARSIMQNITQAIQFSGQGVTPPTGDHFCVGGNVYMYSKGVQLTSTDDVGSGHWGLYEASTPSDSCKALTGPQAGGTELLGPRMRIADIGIDQSGDMYKVRLVVAYGDSDLLCSPAKGSTKGGCEQNAPSYDRGAVWAAPDMLCKAQTGSQFCAVSSLSTAVVKRVE